jgi:hypothetical protein
MAKEQKEILRMFLRYAEMVNAQFGEMDYRLRILEAAMAADPHLTTYSQAVRDAKRREFPLAIARSATAAFSNSRSCRDASGLKSDSHALESSDQSRPSYHRVSVDETEGWESSIVHDIEDLALCLDADWEGIRPARCKLRAPLYYSLRTSEGRVGSSVSNAV